MNRAALVDLWLRHLDGEKLTIVERDALLRGWESDPALRQLCEEDIALDGALRSRPGESESDRAFLAGVATMLCSEGDAGRFASRVRRRIKGQATTKARSWWTASRWAMAATLMLALGGIWWLTSTTSTTSPIAPPPVPVATAPGPEAGNHLPRMGATALKVGSVIGGAQAITLDWSDGSQGVLAAGSRLEILDDGRGKSLLLSRGRIEVAANAQPAGQAMQVRTSEALATVVGTHFILEVTAGSTVLRVSKGCVRLTAPHGEELSVNAGTGAIASATGVAWLPLWSCDAGDATAPQPYQGRRGTAPDGRSCFIGVNDPSADPDVKGIRFLDTAGLFTYDPTHEVWCEMWFEPDTVWAGLYLQDDGHGRGEPRPSRHGQIDIPVKEGQGGWRRIRLDLGRLTALKRPVPPMQAGDRANYLVVQGQVRGDGSGFYLAKVEVLPARR